MKKITTTWHFEAQDSLFFRESRPMNSIGNAELSSVFPPSAQTLAGAIRRTLGEIKGVDWGEFRKQKQAHPLAKMIGCGDDFASLHFNGIWVHKEGERLYPAPFNLMLLNQAPEDASDTAKKLTYPRCFFIRIDDKATQTDLGNIRLPKLSKDEAGSKNLANIWLNKTNYQNVLKGIAPEPNDWFILKSPSNRQQKNSLLVEEPRIGIGLDNQKRAVKKGILYQTQHIRFNEGVSLAMDVSIDQQYQSISQQADDHFLTRLGGEGRLASICQTAIPSALEAGKIQHKFVIYLLTPLLIKPIEGKPWQPLPNFQKERDEQTERDQQRVWKGTLKGVEITLHSAVTAKAHQEGGWDLLKNRPKPLRSYIPAGSAFYCSSEADPQTIITALHYQQIGTEQKLGRGKIAIGQWI